jgi:hypothetical protein
MWRDPHPIRRPLSFVSHPSHSNPGLHDRGTITCELSLQVYKGRMRRIDVLHGPGAPRADDAGESRQGAAALGTVATHLASDNAGRRPGADLAAAPERGRIADQTDAG